ncbi:hypothetical protein O1611_g1556 [Lasiodiplodia mahajangana]|uniref:Uncharacterized protein n=1 Tax=Lasiodiplodia mahajangana TaxID=1108764 RepID=A0ACC2JXY4_9PEZI|nr:hypothetical protein O1611_g1556 [Lasiodiplodia mahajangana]
MPKLVTVVGATGNQGRAVIDALISDPNYALRGLTRNIEGKGAQQLKSQGVEVVTASLDDLASLKAAFAGSYAVYGVTGIDDLLANHDLTTVEKIEETWGQNIAQAAAETVGLQHFIWSSLPHASDISNGRYHLYNHVGKNKVDDYIRANADLAAKTTILVIGQYHSNYSYNAISIYPIPSANAYVHFASHSPETPIYWIGNVTRNLRPFIKPILEQPEKTKGSVVFAYSDVYTSEDSLQIWAKTKGVRAFHVPASIELVHALWGKYADVLATMWRYWGEFGEKSWSAPGHTLLTKEDLGVTDLVSLAESFRDYEL